ncbi:MAG: flagellar hook capping FlgD N-terminal domain-containing protein [Candidatus Kapaibacterium sp.]|jgi:flagellar basal-body rod modification protein FlgD
MTEGISTNNSAQNITAGSGVMTQSVVGKDEFLKLLTYQLRSQNPLKPYDNQEFAAQLAQFSQLEQLVDIRSLIEEQVYTNNVLTQTIANSALPGMIGKNARALTDSFNYDGMNKPSLSYDLPINVSTANLIIKDGSGKIIRTVELDGNYLKQGTHKFEWDGTNNSGESVGGGKYTFTVEGKDSEGGNYSAYTFIYGKIEAVRFKSEGTMLVINGNEMALNSISDISDN